MRPTPRQASVANVFWQLDLRDIWPLELQAEYIYKEMVCFSAYCQSTKKLNGLEGGQE